MIRIPYGSCHCGCGRRTERSASTCVSRGRIAGEPQKFLRGHNMRPDRSLVAVPVCKAEGCECMAPDGGLCSFHRRMAECVARTCSVDGCDASHSSAGFCRRHYYKFWKYGDPLGKAPPRERRSKSRRISNGYVYLFNPEHPAAHVSGYVAEHRLVMERQVGRLLLPHERVHHRNGVKTDNSVDNLELWSTDHPAGQRVSDKLRWAMSLVATYGTDPSVYD